jgi:hypothetical protein
MEGAKASMVVCALSTDCFPEEEAAVEGAPCLNAASANARSVGNVLIVKKGMSVSYVQSVSGMW